MKDFDPWTAFTGKVAETYDRGVRGDEDETVEFLAQLAGDGPALELAIGTGRIALALAARGTRVDGIEISPDMVAQLRAKPGGDRIAITIGDFAEVGVSDSYRLIYVVFNTLYNLLTQDHQVRCFENVASHLTDDGAFVVEANVPGSLYRLRDNQYVDAEAIDVGEVRLDVGRHDPVNQLLDESHVALTANGIELSPIVTRYVWPSEMDLMARIGGLRLADRWGGWNGEPFSASSTRHISVYTR